MSLQMAGGSGESADFGAVSGVFGLSSVSIICTIVQTVSTSNTYRIFEVVNPAGTNTNERYLLQLNATNDAKNFAYFKTSTVNVGGEWRSNSNTVPLNTVTHIAVTHNFSSINNDPLFYVNGASATVNEQNTPSGDWRNTGATNCYLGGRSGINAYYGTLYNITIYNRVLSAAEILDAYNSRLAIPSYNGLVFAPDLRGAAGGVGDGSTLAAGNVIRDHISGASGVPAGSPVLRADTYLNYK
jgi:hypothetical protein